MSTVLITKKKAEFGLSEPIYDAISTIGQNLEYNDFEDN